MRRALSILAVSLVTGFGCQDNKVKPGEIAATITSEVIADNWLKGCSSGGLEIKIGQESYIISNSVPATYAEANSRPLSVWIRYQPDEPDTCSHWTNRIRILSIRKRS